MTMLSRDILKQGIKEKINNAMQSSDLNEFSNVLADIICDNSEKEGNIVVNQSVRVEEKFRAVKQVVLPGEKISQSIKPKMDLGNLIKGMAGKGWTGAESEKQYIQQMASTDNGIVIPSELSEKIIDVARSQNSIVGRIPIIPMDSNNLTVAVQTKDANAGFVKEGDLIPTSEPVFKGVQMVGKTIAVFVPVSEQLLDSAKNLSSQLQLSCANAITKKLDEAILYGVGDGTAESGEIKGITTYTDINKVEEEAEKFNIDYDLILKGLRQAKKSNISPTDISYNSDMGTTLSMLKDATGQYITKPTVLDNYVETESNNIKDDEVVLYNSDYLLLGIHKNIKIEWGCTADQFQRIQKGLRLYMRCDVAVLNDKAVTLVKKLVS